MRENIVRRFEELIDKGKSLAKKDMRLTENAAEHIGWELNCLSILEKTFGKEKDHYLGFKLQQKKYLSRVARLLYEVACIESAKEEIEKGFLYKIENLISADLFDSILEHAEYLLSRKHKDPAAVLGRVVIENTLRNIAERENISLPEKVKLSRINEILWKNEVYTKITWRLIQGYVDLGNFAAHGDFDKYDEDKVQEMLNWIRKHLMSL